MPKATALKIILVISTVGVLFSGYLSYTEVIIKNCTLGCSAAGNILGLPVCVYGFSMFLLVFLTALLSQPCKKKQIKNKKG